LLFQNNSAHIKSNLPKLANYQYIIYRDGIMIVVKLMRYVYKFIIH